ncbi:hypothetical protein EXIGUO8H_130005 [Exiguobacterium sp. 8H]|uniref:hypothetical protein n=1 Tax=unclassified Exiguobacterium TaxID=2644629 RepID=UPI0012F189BF|nr:MULTISPECIES: hypothetical protein [unclassified Exiguobacterium]VXB38617.1 hypothetical protein EXIGUO8H_130005 [Exiguobacterium sp. 8H]VXB96560.1 hypothetical protein EXIGUO8A_340005 [Exiguobacterium sp. 8A]
MNLRSIKIKEDTYEMLMRMKEKNSFASMDDVIRHFHHEYAVIENVKSRLQQLQQENDALHRAYVKQQNVSHELKNLHEAVETIGKKIETRMIGTKHPRDRTGESASFIYEPTFLKKRTSQVRFSSRRKKSQGKKS